MKALQKELDELRETRAREKEREARRAREDEEELQILRDRCEKLEDERVNFQGGVSNPYWSRFFVLIIKPLRPMSKLLTSSALTWRDF